MNKELVEKQNAIIKYGLFIINPFFGLLATLRDLKSKSSYTIFYLFCLLVGMCFTVPSGTTAEYTGDGARYRQKFEKIAFNSNRTFEEIYKEYTQFDEGEKDLYSISVFYLVSGFTTNYHWVFFFFSVVFGFFMLKSFKFLTDNKEFTNSLYCFALAFIFILSNSIVNINGVRFWTAAWIAVYCVFQIVVNKNKKYFVLAILTPYIHVSYFVFVVVLLIAFFTKNRNNFWFVLFLISFFVSSFAQELLKAVEDALPAFISRTIALYTDADIIAAKEEKRAWFVDLFSFAKLFFLNVIIFVLYRNKTRLFQSKEKAYNVFLFLLVWMTFVNFTSTVLSLGGRFIFLALPLITYIWLFTLKNSKKYNTLLLLFLVVFAFDFYGQFKLMLKATEIEFYIASPIYLIYNQLF